MNRRSFFMWTIGVGTALILPSSVRPPEPWQFHEAPVYRVVTWGLGGKEVWYVPAWDANDTLISPTGTSGVLEEKLVWPPR